MLSRARLFPKPTEHKALVSLTSAPPQFGLELTAGAITIIIPMIPLSNLIHLNGSWLRLFPRTLPGIAEASIINL